MAYINKKSKNLLTTNLEKKMIHYRDLIEVPVKENNELFVKLDPSKIPNGYLPEMSDMSMIAGPHIIVRQGVYDRLLKAQSQLKGIRSGFTLFVTYGYRSLEVQTKNFLQHLKNTTEYFFSNPYDLYEEVHRFIAVPTVAGHPTGGAIDIVIKDEKTNKILDFGSDQYDYSTKDCYVFIDTIKNEAKEYRMLLRKVLLENGFAPFDGEWWHFSYGDREWAYYYKKPYAIYKQVKYEQIISSIRKI